jgi:hypothetical protein
MRNRHKVPSFLEKNGPLRTEASPARGREQLTNMRRRRQHKVAIHHQRVK